MFYNGILFLLNLFAFFFSQASTSRSRTSNPGSDERRGNANGGGGSGGSLVAQQSAFALLGSYDDDKDKKKKKKDSKVSIHISRVRYHIESFELSAVGVRLGWGRFAKTLILANSLPNLASLWKLGFAFFFIFIKRCFGHSPYPSLAKFVENLANLFHFGKFLARLGKQRVENEPFLLW